MIEGRRGVSTVVSNPRRQTSTTQDTKVDPRYEKVSIPEMNMLKNSSTHAIIVHRCGASGSIRACDATGPGSIPGRDKFPA